MKKKQRSFWKSVRDWISGVRILGILLGLLGIIFGLIGNSISNPGTPITVSIVDNYWNSWNELISIAFTVLIIDGLNEIRERRAETRMEKSRLLHQMASPNNMFSVEGCRQLRAHGWLQDGALSGAFLIGADLNGVDLSVALLNNANLTRAALKNADLSYSNFEGSIFRAASLKNVNLKEANLSKSNFRYADLSNAVIREANLQSTHLSEANLKGANLLWANLTNAPMINTKFDEMTILPDGSNWIPDTDMKMFSDKNHPAYIRYETRWED